MKSFIRILFLAIIAVGTFTQASARLPQPRYLCTPMGKITVDSVDYRKDLTRVYCKVHGRPHTSLKFNDITNCTDIDGVDMQRWFQFEDEGFIPLELDFPPMTAPASTQNKATKKAQVQKKPALPAFTFTINSTAGPISVTIKR